MIIAPSVGVFRPLEDVEAGALVDEGQTVGHLDGPGTSTPVRSPFAGRVIGMLVHGGERLREGQPVAWLRVA
jgi:biotin carboxyl carrier protein